MMKRIQNNVIVIAALVLLIFGSPASAQQGRGASSHAPSTSKAANAPASEAGKSLPNKPAPKDATASATSTGNYFLACVNPRLAMRVPAQTQPQKPEAAAPQSPTQPKQDDPSLAFTSRRWWDPRPVSAFPETAGQNMFMGSRLRGPFDRIYPRPFYGGGQP